MEKINMHATIVAFITNNGKNAKEVVTSAGQTLHTHRESNESEIKGLTVEEYIVQERPIYWQGLTPFYGVIHLGTLVPMQHIELPSYDKIVSVGRGYTGGHNSQSEFPIRDAEEIEGAIVFDQTWSGTYGGYYPMIVNFIKKEKVTIFCGYKDLAKTMPVWREVLK